MPSPNDNLEKYFNYIFETGVSVGLNYADMLEMTIGEIQLTFNGINKRKELEFKEGLTRDYNLAVNTATFTIMMLNGKGQDIPDLHRMYPDVFGPTSTEEYMLKFKAFAIKFNSMRNKGGSNG